MNTNTKVKYERILTIITNETRHERVYTRSTFAHRFTSMSYLGSEASLQSLLLEMSIKGIIAYFENGAD